jgi:hypothetical protein
LWAIIADPHLNSTDKIVATVMLLKFRNKDTSQCNPSYSTVACVIGRSRGTVMDAVAPIKVAGYLTVHGTKGGSARNTNQFDFHPKMTGGGSATGGEDTTGGTVADRSGEETTERVELPPHELSFEPSRTNIGDQVEVERPDGWIILGDLPGEELARLTELERIGNLTDEMLELAIVGIKLAEKRTASNAP